MARRQLAKMQIEISRALAEMHEDDESSLS